MAVEDSTQAIAPQLTEDSTSRLMRMLESVRLEKTQAEAGNSATAARTTCPQCDSPEPWGNASWCPECGYYPKLGRAMTPSEIDSNQDRKSARSYLWLVWLGVGLLILSGFSVALRAQFPDAGERGAFGRVQFISGFMLLLAAQVRAYLIATQGRDNLPFSSIFFEPFQVWLPVLQQLPRSRHTCYWGAWGGVAMMLALCVSGVDFDGMFSRVTSKKPKKSMMQMIVQTVSAVSGKSAPAASSAEDESGAGGLTGAVSGLAGTDGNAGAGDLEGAMKDLAGNADAITEASGGDAGKDPAAQIAANFSGNADPSAKSDTQKPLFESRKIPPTASGKERDEHGAFVIFGYLTNHAGEIRSLLLADVRSRRARYAGKLSLDELSEEERSGIQSQLEHYRSSRPALRIPNQARWVKPVIVARVAHVGWTADGQLREAFLVTMEQAARPNVSSAQNTPQP